MQNFFLLLCLIFPLTVFGYTPQEGSVTATLGPYFYRTNYLGKAPSVNSPYLGGVGLVVNGDVSDHGALEIALFHLNKLYFREQSGETLVEKTALLQINMGYRYWWNSWFSSSLAFYSSYSLGGPITVYNSTAVNNGVQTSAEATTMYGFDFALQQELWNHDRLSLMLDERYSRSVTSKSGEDADDYGVMIGLRYFVQEKQIVEGPPPLKK